MQPLKEYYNKENITITFEPERQGYWLKLNNDSYFLQEDVFNDISREKGDNLINKLKSVDPLIIESLKNQKIFLSKLETAFLRTNQTNKKEMENSKIEYYSPYEN